jgi:hypothetical protein
MVMSRLVRLPKPEVSDDLLLAGYDKDLFDAPEQQAAPTDGYLQRVAKYVPAEVLAFFILINAIIDQTIKNAGAAATMAHIPAMFVAIGALIAAMVVVPVYVWYVHKEGDAWITNAYVSFLAFPVWAYAIGAIAFGEYRDGNLAAILLTVFTALSGLIVPSAPRRGKKQSASPMDGPRLVEPLPGRSA